jgi:DNA modification methylase
MSARHTKELLRASEKSYSELEDICVWVTDKGGKSSLYRSQHELVFVFKNGTDQPRNKILAGKSHCRSRTNVWHYPSVNSKVGKERKEQKSSVTRWRRPVKPVAMVADAIVDCTAHGDIILDPFAGTGTTLLAAERVNRIAYAIERNPSYVDLAIRRWEKCTGKVAILERSMCSFTQVREQKYEPQR